MNNYTITIMTGNKVTSCTVKAMSAEMAVRSIMCWYSNNTLFTINNVTYKKVATNNSVTGYTELIKV